MRLIFTLNNKTILIVTVDLTKQTSMVNHIENNHIADHILPPSQRKYNELEQYLQCIMHSNKSLPLLLKTIKRTTLRIPKTLQDAIALSKNKSSHKHHHIPHQQNTLILEITS